MEEVEGRLKCLRLSEAEMQGVRIGRRGPGVVVQREVQAIGKVISEKAAKAEVLEQTLGKCWCPIKGARCKDLGGNIFLFTFGQDSGKRKAIEEGPWWAGKDLIVMEDFVPTKLVEEYEFRKVPIWVQISRLPLGMMDQITGEDVGAKIGEVEEVDTDADGNAIGKFLRVKVKLDITKPLMRGSMVQVDDSGKTVWCPFAYEFLPDFCYVCGVIGHMDKECKLKLKKGETPQFGGWMKANIDRMKMDDRSRWSGGGSRGSSSGRQFGFNRRDGRPGSDNSSWRKDGSGGGKKVDARVEDQSPPKLTTAEKNDKKVGDKEADQKGAQNKLHSSEEVEGNTQTNVIEDLAPNDEGNEKVIEGAEETVSKGAGQDGFTKAMEVDEGDKGEIMGGDMQYIPTVGEVQTLGNEGKKFKRRVREKSVVVTSVSSEGTLTGKKRSGEEGGQGRSLKKGKGGVTSDMATNNETTSAGLQEQPRRSQ
jgi:hypothetical protein